jgi:hypothetical protein
MAAKPLPVHPQCKISSAYCSVDIGEAQDSQILEESGVKANKINPSIINNKQEELNQSKEYPPENNSLAKLVSRDSNLLKLRSRLAISPGSSPP